MDRKEGKREKGSNPYVASKVIYVPPINGSEILAWKAEIATNMTVLVNVEKICDAMTVNRYHVWTPSFGNIITTP